MAYAGPTSVPRSDLIPDEVRKFDDLSKTLPDPARPYHVEDFDELAKTLPQVAAFPHADEVAQFDALSGKLPGLAIGGPDLDSPSSHSPAVANALGFLKGLPQEAPGAPEGTPGATEAQETHADTPYPTSIGDAIKKAVDQGTGQTPDIPPLPFSPTGPFRPLPGMPNKPTQPDQEVQEKITSDEPLSAQDFVSSLTKASMNQGTSPAFGEGVPGIRVGTSEEEAAARALGGAEKALGAEGPAATARTVYGGAAEELKAGLDLLERAHVPVPRKLAEEAAVSPPSSAGFRQFWDRARNVIEQQGEAGKELAQKLRDWRETAETTAGEWTTRLQTVRKLGKAEFNNFVDVAEGKAEPVNEMVAKAVGEWRAVSDDVYARAERAGVPVAEKIEAYFPHVFEPDAFNPSKRTFADAAEHLVTTGQANNLAEAMQRLRSANDVNRTRRYGNLEIGREFDLPFYRRDKGVLFGQGGHLEEAADRIAQVETFGNKDAGALDLIRRIGQEGGDDGAVKALFDIAVGAKKYGSEQVKWSNRARSFNTVASLGLSAITNAGQSVNTASVAGFGNTGKAVVKYLTSPEAREEAVAAGVTLENVVKDVRESVGFGRSIASKVTAPGFATVERFNRGVSYHAGVGYAEDAARKGDLAALEALGLNARAVAERGTLTEAEKVAAGRRVVERTQFKVDPQDLPGWANSPWGKVATQFKSFSYNQSAFMGREIIGPALHGDPVPLTRFMIAGLIAGAATTEARNAVQGRAPEQDTAKRVLQYYNAVGGLGLVGDALRVAGGITNINAQNLDPERQVTQAYSTVFGPTVGKAGEVLGGIAQATRGNPEPLERVALRQVPVVGTTLQNLVAPYKAQPANDQQFTLPQLGGTRSGTRETRTGTRSGTRR